MACTKNASGHGSDELNCAQDVEGQPPKGAEADIDPTSQQSCPEVHEDEQREEEEEMKRASKFAYSTIGIAVAGIISIFSGYLGDQTGHANTVHLKVCTFFMLATFISGFSMLLLIWRRRSYRISIKIFRGLKATALVFLSLAVFDVSFLFLKTLAILAFVPALVIVMIAFYMAEVHRELYSYFCSA